MLKFLEIRQFALIDHLNIEFHEGLNLLTGETGSGKSIIVDALGLLLGEKGYAEMIRSGAERAVISGLFELEREDRLRRRLVESGLDSCSDEIIIKRELTQSGKGRAFVNNQMVPISFLKGISKFLVDIHGQNEQQALYQRDSQLSLLDAFASAEALLTEIDGLYNTWQEILTHIDQLKKNEQERLRTIDLLIFQAGEIEKSKLKSENEDEQLAIEHALLANADKLFQLSRQAYAELYDAETSVSASVKHASRLLEELSHVDPRCRELLEPLKSARIAIDDVALSLREYSSKIEANPQRLEQVEVRMAEIDRLKRKYGRTVKDILAFYRKTKSELENLLKADENVAILESRILAAAGIYRKKARELSDKRRSSATLLEKNVEKELKQLAMERARFRIFFFEPEKAVAADQGRPQAGETPTGIDNIEFLLGANPGEDLKPLAKIASGGEISRIMLALKSVKTVDGRGKSLVFDEVDAGIGGQTADVLGQKLKRLAKNNQVICVTHLPQIASYADSHYFIEKKVEKGRTLTRVARLDLKDRIQEIARMISGERMTESVLKHAAELLKSAGR